MLIKRREVSLLKALFHMQKAVAEFTWKYFFPLTWTTLKTEQGIIGKLYTKWEVTHKLLQDILKGDLKVLTAVWMTRDLNISYSFSPLQLQSIKGI